LISRRSPRKRYCLLTQHFAADYEDLGVIGTGGFAEVHRARNRLDGRIYAVKIITLKPTDNIEQTEEHFYRALSEVKIHAQLTHPQVLRYHGCWIELIPFSPAERDHLLEEEPPEPEF
jgi:eukaryotic translation initiation factor 2-alpha kinase 4